CALYHSQSIEARFATPGLKIVIPSTPYEAKGLLLAAIRDPDPVLFFEHKRLYRMFKEAVPKGEYLIPLQVARTARDGTDISVFCYGLMVHYAIEAAKNLEADGVSVEIVDLRTVYPLDKEAILASARKTGKCLVLYEDNFSVSVGSEVAAIIADEAWRWLDETVQAGAEIAVVETGDGAVTATPEAPAGPPPPRGEGQGEGREQKQPEPTALVETVESGEHRYSPGVQMAASELKVDLAKVTGTGLGGRVTRKDVQDYAAKAATAPAAAPAPAAPAKPGEGDQVVQLTRVRRLIAENMTRSKQTI